MSYKEDHCAVLNSCGTVYKLDLSDKGNQLGKIHVDLATGELNRILEAFYESLPPKQKEMLTDNYEKLSSAISDRTGKFSVIIKPVLNKNVLMENDDYILS